MAVGYYFKSVENFMTEPMERRMKHESIYLSIYIYMSEVK